MTGLLMRQAPIVGDEGCVRFCDAAAHATLPAPSFSLSGGFSVLLDFQGDKIEEQTILGGREEGGSTLVLTDCPDGVWGSVRLEVRDRAGRMFVADACTSGAHGRRLLCRLVSEENRLSVVELQPWSPPEPLAVSVLRADSPTDFPGFVEALCLSGCNDDGNRSGQFLGRAANVALFDRTLGDDRIGPYRAASNTRAREDLPSGSTHALDDEGRRLFLDDAEHLAEWIDAGKLSRRDTRHASGLAFRWLCDRRPLLKRVADHYGVLLSLPDLDPRRALTDAMLQDEPVFYYHRDVWEGDWLALSAFRGDLAFWVAGERRISWEGFVKFVRNKLGGGHFDPEDRKRWQVQLDSMIRETEVNGEAWIDVKMLALVQALMLSAESCGLLALAQYPLA